MSIKEIKEAMENGDVLIGLRQTLKSINAGKGGKRKSKLRVFVAKDARESVLKNLEGVKISFEVLKSKEEMAREIGLDFESEVYSIK